MLDSLLNLPSCFLEGTFYLQKVYGILCAVLWLGKLFLAMLDSLSPNSETLILHARSRHFGKMAGLTSFRFTFDAREELPMLATLCKRIAKGLLDWDSPRTTKTTAWLSQ